jgi:hypothetical protein
LQQFRIVLDPEPFQRRSKIVKYLDCDGWPTFSSGYFVDTIDCIRGYSAFPRAASKYSVALVAC